MIIELSWSTVLHALLSSETILCHLDEGPPIYKSKADEESVLTPDQVRSTFSSTN